jgi:hypothetical protein
MRISSPLMHRFQVTVTLACSMNDPSISFMLPAYHVGTEASQSTLFDSLVSCQLLERSQSWCCLVAMDETYSASRK